MGLTFVAFVAIVISDLVTVALDLYLEPRVHESTSKERAKNRIKS